MILVMNFLYWLSKFLFNQNLINIYCNRLFEIFA